MFHPVLRVRKSCVECGLDPNALLTCEAVCFLAQLEFILKAILPVRSCQRLGLGVRVGT